MNHFFRKTKIGFLSLASLSIITPTTICLVGCSGSQSNSHTPDVAQTQSEPQIPSIPLEEIQTQANEITSIDDAATFINQVLLKYYNLDMLKEDYGYAIHYLEESEPGASSFSQYKTYLKSMTPNNDKKLVNFSVSVGTLSISNDERIEWRVAYDCYNIPFVPILVNVQGTIYMGLWEPIFSGGGSDGDVTLSNKESLNESPTIFATETLDDGNIVQTKQYSISYAPISFQQNVIYDFVPDDYHYDKNQAWWAEYNGTRITWFASKYLTIKFPKLSQPVQKTNPTPATI